MFTIISHATALCDRQTRPKKRDQNLLINKSICNLLKIPNKNEN